MGLSGIFGCGATASGGLATVPAAGTVTFKGQPVESGSIQFVSPNGRPANGEIVGGKFTLSTYQDGDGAIPGKASVGITSTTEKPSTKPGAEPATVHLVPSKYSSPEASGITFEIPSTGTKKILIELN
jgi:hypothetical protein